MSKQKKNRKKQLQQEQRRARYATAWDDNSPAASIEVPAIQPPDIKVEYIDHTEEGILFLDLVQAQMGVKLSVDDYHFHYFLGANEEFIGVVEIQIYEGLDTSSITKAMFNYQWREVGLALMAEVLGETFDSVYIGEVGVNAAQLVKDRKMSRMFNPWDRKEIQSTMIRRLTEEEKQELGM